MVRSSVRFLPFSGMAKPQKAEGNGDKKEVICMWLHNEAAEDEGLNNIERPGSLPGYESSHDPKAPEIVLETLVTIMLASVR